MPVVPTYNSSNNQLQANLPQAQVNVAAPQGAFIPDTVSLGQQIGQIGQQYANASIAHQQKIDEENDTQKVLDLASHLNETIVNHENDYKTNMQGLAANQVVGKTTDLFESLKSDYNSQLTNDRQLRLFQKIWTDQKTNAINGASNFTANEREKSLVNSYTTNVNTAIQLGISNPTSENVDAVTKQINSIELAKGSHFGLSKEEIALNQLKATSSLNTEIISSLNATNPPAAQQWLQAHKDAILPNIYSDLQEKVDNNDRVIKANQEIANLMAANPNATHLQLYDMIKQTHANDPHIAEFENTLSSVFNMVEQDKNQKIPNEATDLGLKFIQQGLDQQEALNKTRSQYQNDPDREKYVSEVNRIYNESQVHRDKTQFAKTYQQVLDLKNQGKSREEITKEISATPNDQYLQTKFSALDKFYADKKANEAEEAKQLTNNVFNAKALNPGKPMNSLINNDQLKRLEVIDPENFRKIVDLSQSEQSNMIETGVVSAKTDNQQWLQSVRDDVDAAKITDKHDLNKFAGVLSPTTIASLGDRIDKVKDVPIGSIIEIYKGRLGLHEQSLYKDGQPTQDFQQFKNYIYSVVPKGQGTLKAINEAADNYFMSGTGISKNTGILSVIKNTFGINNPTERNTTYPEALKQGIPFTPSPQQSNLDTDTYNLINNTVSNLNKVGININNDQQTINNIYSQYYISSQQWLQQNKIPFNQDTLGIYSLLKMKGKEFTRDDFKNVASSYSKELKKNGNPQ